MGIKIFFLWFKKKKTKKTGGREREESTRQTETERGRERERESERFHQDLNLPSGWRESGVLYPPNHGAT